MLISVVDYVKISMLAVFQVESKVVRPFRILEAFEASQLHYIGTILPVGLGHGNGLTRDGDVWVF